MARGNYTFELRAGPHGESDLSVTRFVGTEALSEPYLYEVDFVPLSGKPIDLEQVVGREACFTVRRTGGAERALHGIVSAARFLGRKKGRWQYRVEVSPRLFLLGIATRSRTFLDLTVPEIVKQVLTEWKVKQRWEVRGSYPARECTAQYRESDLTFVSRLMEQEGIWYRFEQGNDGATMVVADGKHAFTEGGRLPFREEGLVAGEEEHLTEVSQRTRRVPGRVVLRDYNFEQPLMDLTVTAEDGKGEEVYEYPGGFTDPEHGKRLAQIRLEELRFPMETYSGRGQALSLAAGHTFDLRRHPCVAWNQKLLAVRVVHEGRRDESAGSVVTHGETRFFAIAASRPYRPKRRTARPEIFGFQRATVVGPDGEEIHTDRYGRVKLAFNWNTGTSEPAKSGWVRVGQPIAGPGFGTFFLPRIGQEVVVCYQGGDPDRPAVMGAVYHGDHPPAVELTKDKTQSTIRTRSSPYNGGFNEVLFEDAGESERIFIHAQKDKKIEVLADKDQRVGGQETLTVKKDRTQQVWGNQALEVSQDDSATVGGNRTLAVVGDRTTTVDGDHSEAVGLAQTVTVEGEHDLSVAQAANVSVGLGATLNVGGAYLVNVGVDHNTLVGGARLEEVGGFKGELVGLHREERIAGDKSLTVKDEMVEQVGGTATRRTDGDEEQVAERIEITAEEFARLAASGISINADTFTVVVGGNVMFKMEKSGRVQFFGKTISVEGAAIQLRGGKIEKVSPAEPEKKKRPSPRLRFFTPVDADGSAREGDAYVLLREDGSVHQRRRLDAVRRGESQGSALFTGLEWGRKYSLMVDRGRDGKHFIFRQKPIEELVATHGDGANGAETVEPTPGKREEGH